MLAEFGTLSVELRELSSVTGDPRYAEAAANIYASLWTVDDNHGLLPQTISFNYSYESAFTTV